MHSPRAIAVPHQQPAPTRDAAIAGLRVLVVEDEPLVAMDISLGLEEGGATIVAVARSLDEAVRSAQLADVDVALLDGNLAGDPVDQVARILHDRGVPFCFVSGYGREHLPTGYPDAPILAKPASPDMLLSPRLARHAAVDIAQDHVEKSPRQRCFGIIAKKVGTTARLLRSFHVA
ncbi:signal transduction histidine kinase (plasmid) [Ketogulonicigenium vulgare Y25]|nr:signal transduction histidine kinase [Ketogulonicigenium vulgare Y25]